MVASMNNPQQLLDAMRDLPLSAPVRVLHLSCDHERLINISGLRQALPEHVKLLAGPGCAASICPQNDLYQAIQLAHRRSVTVLAGDNVMRLPLHSKLHGPHSLQAAADAGADVRMINSPIEAVVAARAEPEREMVLFVAGFETLLAPLAGLMLDGMPDNLSVLACGRTVQPMLERILTHEPLGFDGLILPGNRCAITGTRYWERILEKHRLPAVVAGYTLPNLLTALHAVLEQHLRGEAKIENRYKVMVRADGNLMARDQLDRVFELTEGTWRGVGRVPDSAYRLRSAYRVFDADHRHPDYRGELEAKHAELPVGCECADVVVGRKEPVDCPNFDKGCVTASPYGPCMASEDGTCYLRSAMGWAA